MILMLCLFILSSGESTTPDLARSYELKSNFITCESFKTPCEIIYLRC